MKFLRAGLIFSLFVALLITSSFAMGQFLLIGHPLEGEQAPDFTLKNLKGQVVNLTSVREDGPAIVFFWAIRCPHCRTQIEDLSAMSSAIEAKGIKLILIDVGESARQVREYFEFKKIRLDSLLDEQADVADNYRLVGIPSYFLIGQDGRVRSVTHAFPEEYEMIFKEDL